MIIDFVGTLSLILQKVNVSVLENAIYFGLLVI